MATPVVAGAAALLAQKFGPSLTPNAITAKLMNSATKSLPTTITWTDPATGITRTIQDDRFTIGAGYLDVLTVLNNNSAIPAGKSALTPKATYICGTAGGSRCVGITHAANSQSTASSTTNVWGNQNAWGGSVLWGDGKGLFPLSILGKGDQ